MGTQLKPSWFVRLCVYLIVCQIKSYGCHTFDVTSSVLQVIDRQPNDRLRVVSGTSRYDSYIPQPQPSYYSSAERQPYPRLPPNHFYHDPFYSPRDLRPTTYTILTTTVSPLDRFLNDVRYKKPDSRVGDLIGVSPDARYILEIRDDGGPNRIYTDLGTTPTLRPVSTTDMSWKPSQKYHFSQRHFVSSGERRDRQRASTEEKTQSIEQKNSTNIQKAAFEPKSVTQLPKSTNQPSLKSQRKSDVFNVDAKFVNATILSNKNDSISVSTESTKSTTDRVSRQAFWGHTPIRPFRRRIRPLPPVIPIPPHATYEDDMPPPPVPRPEPHHELWRPIPLHPYGYTYPRWWYLQRDVQREIDPAEEENSNEDESSTTESSSKTTGFSSFQPNAQRKSFQRPSNKQVDNGSHDNKFRPNAENFRPNSFSGTINQANHVTPPADRNWIPTYSPTKFPERVTAPVLPQPPVVVTPPTQTTYIASGTTRDQQTSNHFYTTDQDKSSQYTKPTTASPMTTSPSYFYPSRFSKSTTEPPATTTPLPTTTEPGTTPTLPTEFVAFGDHFTTKNIVRFPTTDIFRFGESPTWFIQSATEPPTTTTESTTSTTTSAPTTVSTVGTRILEQETVAPSVFSPSFSGSTGHRSSNGRTRFTEKELYVTTDTPSINTLNSANSNRQEQYNQQPGQTTSTPSNQDKNFKTDAPAHGGVFRSDSSLRGGEIAGMVVGILTIIAALAGCLTYAVLRGPLGSRGRHHVAPSPSINSSEAFGPSDYVSSSGDRSVRPLQHRLADVSDQEEASIHSRKMSPVFEHPSSFQQDEENDDFYPSLHQSIHQSLNLRSAEETNRCSPRHQNSDDEDVDDDHPSVRSTFAHEYSYRHHTPGTSLTRS